MEWSWLTFPGVVALGIFIYNLVQARRPFVRIAVEQVDFKLPLAVVATIRNYTTSGWQDRLLPADFDMLYTLSWCKALVNIEIENKTTSVLKGSNIVIDGSTVYHVLIRRPSGEETGALGKQVQLVQLGDIQPRGKVQVTLWAVSTVQNPLQNYAFHSDESARLKPRLIAPINETNNHVFTINKNAAQGIMGGLLVLIGVSLVLYAVYR